MHWAEFYHNKRFYMVCKDALQANSLHTLAPATILRAVTWGTSAWLCVHSPAQLCSPKLAPECSHSRMATRECWGYVLLHYQGKLAKKSRSVSGTPASSQFNPFL